MLKGFADPDGDPLFITDLKANNGELKAAGDGIWTLIPPKDFNGTIELSYAVADDLGAKMTAKQTVKLAAVNDNRCAACRTCAAGTYSSTVCSASADAACTSWATCVTATR